MKRTLSRLLILPLIFAVFSVQAELATEHSMSGIESCLCNDVVDNSVNKPCSTASVLFFALEPLNISNDTLFFDRAAFVDYKSYLLRQHKSRLFRPPIIYLWA
jgi:hypothetical protein